MSVPIKQLQFLGFTIDVLEDDGSLKESGEHKISFEVIKEKVNNISFFETCTRNEEDVLKELLSKDVSIELSLRLIRDVFKHKWEEVKLVNGLDNIIHEVDFDIEIEKDCLIIKYSKK